MKKDPDNLALLLQLAKLYRLEHDFLNLMRFFRKLQALAPPDPYTQGQIASLLSAGEPTPGFATRAVPLGAGGTPRTVPVIPRDETSRRGLIAAALVVATLAALGAWWVKRAPRLPSGERPPTPAVAPAAVVPVRPGGGADATLERVLERGALLEKESGRRAGARVLRRGRLHGAGCVSPGPPFDDRRLGRENAGQSARRSRRSRP